MPATETDVVQESELARVVDWRLRALTSVAFGEHWIEAGFRDETTYP